MTRISYGKLAVPVHCVGVPPLRGLPEIPESPVRALDSGLLACEVSMEVLGQGFLPAYTEGDNRDVVATDTMKNVILRHALEHADPVPEAFLASLGPALPRRLRGDGDAAAARRASCRSRPSRRRAASCSRSRAGEHGVAELELDRDGRCSASAAAWTDCGCSRRPAPRSPASRATTRRRCPSAPTGRCSSTWTCLALRRPGRRARRRPVPLRRAGPGARRDLRGLRRVRQRVDPAPRARDRAAAARPLPGARRGLLRGREPHARPGAGLRRRAPTRRAYTAAFPAYGLITLTLTR